MKLQVDLSKEYGIVLEGGGAKGAYQIGAWKALKEAGVKIRGISGVSVGALNGALMCMDDLDRAVDLWENISYSKVMNVEDDTMDHVVKGTIGPANIAQMMRDTVKIIVEGGIDIAPLKKLIEDNVDENRLRASDKELFIITYSVTDHQLLDVEVKEVPEGLISDMLLASAYFLAFKNQKLHGKKYMDGGGWNNVPLDSLLERGYKDIIVLRIYGLGQEKKFEIPEDTNLYHVAPRQNLGKTLEFDSKKSRRNIKLGYFDCMRFLYGLEGRHYYLDMPKAESYYFQKFLKCIKKADVGGDHSVFLADPVEGSVYRAVFETVLPKIAKDLSLKPGWTYKELYLQMLEDTARALRISRFNIYTEQELMDVVRGRADFLRNSDKELPIYMDILDIAARI